jgi:hypothetical protein
MTPPAAPRELRPVGAELEFHGNARDDAHSRKLMREDLRPEARGLVVAVVVGAQRHEFHQITISSARPMVSCGNR